MYLAVYLTTTPDTLSCQIEFALRELHSDEDGLGKKNTNQRMSHRHKKKQPSKCKRATAAHSSSCASSSVSDSEADEGSGEEKKTSTEKGILLSRKITAVQIYLQISNTCGISCVFLKSKFMYRSQETLQKQH